MKASSVSLSAVTTGFSGSFGWGYYVGAGYFAYTGSRENTPEELCMSLMTLPEQA